MFKDKSWYKYIIFIITALLYMLVYFHRVSTNAIADDLMESININATELGTISSTYFIFYAIMQPFIGILTDKLGAKKVISIFLGMAIIGSIAFGFVDGFWSAIISRSLIGLGVSGIFVPSLKLHAQWFSPERFARVNGAFVGIGHSGALIATTPLAYLAVTCGWREVFFLIAGLSAIMFLITLLFLHNKEDDLAEEGIPINKPLTGSREAIKTLMRMKNFWLLIVIFFATFGAYMSFQGLWATKYLLCLKNLSIEAANTIIFFIPVGVILGALAAGFLSDKLFKSRKKPLIFGLGLTLFSWVFITFFTPMFSETLLMFIFFMFGVGGGILLPLIFIIIKDKIPSRVTGTALGLINPAYFFGIFFYQIITGLILDVNSIKCQYTPESYYIMMLFCLITFVFTTILSFFIDETFPKDGEFLK
jgi:sugar phosphate permease